MNPTDADRWRVYAAAALNGFAALEEWPRDAGTPCQAAATWADCMMELEDDRFDPKEGDNHE